MSRAIRLYTAVGVHGTAHGIEALQQRHEAGQTLPTLLCDGGHCTAGVRFVAAHRSASVDVPAYLTLEKEAVHSAACRYNVPARLQEVLAGTADPECLHPLEDGTHELRLLALHQGLKRGGGPQLDAPLRTLGALLALRALCDDDALLAAHLVLRLGKKKLAWDAFFYDQEHYDAAWHRLDAASGDIPLALSGTVRSHRTLPSAGGFSTTYLNCAPKYQQTGIADFREFVEVSVGHDDAAWLQSFPVGSRIVMFGLWRHGNSHTATRPHPTDTRRTITNVTHKLALRPGSKLQLTAVA